MKQYKQTKQYKFAWMTMNQETEELIFGSGESSPSQRLAVAWAVYGNNKHKDIYHWVETVEDNADGIEFRDNGERIAP